MNKKTYIIIGIVLLFVLIILSAVVTKKEETTELSNDPDVIYENAQKESAAVKDNEKKEFTQINLDTYFEMYKNEANDIVLIARPTCGYCQIAEPIIQNVAYEYSLKINYLNTDNFENTEEQTLQNSDEHFSSGLGTPTLVIVGGGKIIDAVDGLVDKAHYIDFFKRNGFIK